MISIAMHSVISCLETTSVRSCGQLAMLSEDAEVDDVTSKPGYVTDQRFGGTATISFSGFQCRVLSL